MKRSLRRLVALLAMGTLAFAQVAVAASACAEGSAGGLRAAASIYLVAAGAGAATMPGGHCAGHAAPPATPPANLCEVHCTDGVTSAAVVDLPPLALVSRPLPEVPVAALPAGSGPDRTSPAVVAAGPPPQL